MMRQNDRTTLYVDFAHIELVNQTLGEAIQTQYFRYYFVLLHISYNLPTFCIFYWILDSFKLSNHYHRVDPYLRKALHQFVKKYHPEYLRGDDEEQDKQSKMFWVSFHNLPTVYPKNSLSYLLFAGNVWFDYGAHIKSVILILRRLEHCWVWAALLPALLKYAQSCYWAISGVWTAMWLFQTWSNSLKYNPCPSTFMANLLVNSTLSLLNVVAQHAWTWADGN